VTEAQQPKTEPREIVELRRLKEQQPDLASAVDLQIELLQLQRRVQTRVPLPAINLEAAHLTTLLTGGPILQFENLKIDWSDVRFLVRAAAAAMRTHEALDAADLRKIDVITRDAERLPSIIRAWFEGTGQSRELPPEVEGLETVLLQAMRPILTRAADAILARVDLTDWTRGYCPVCGGEPDLAVITPAAERLLICSRCLARWPLSPPGLRCVRAISEGLRRAQCVQAGHAGGGLGGDAAARRGGDAARVQIETPSAHADGVDSTSDRWLPPSGGRSTPYFDS